MGEAGEGPGLGDGQASRGGEVGAVDTGTDTCVPVIASGGLGKSNRLPLICKRGKARKCMGGAVSAGFRATQGLQFHDV